MASCSHPRRYWENLYVLSWPGMGAKTTFGRVPLCQDCHLITGEVKIAWWNPEVKPISQKFTGLSWRAMVESHPKPPFWFELGSAGILIPVNYKGDLKAQP